MTTADAPPPSDADERAPARAWNPDEMPEPHDAAELAPYVFGEPERETRTDGVNS